MLHTRDACTQTKQLSPGHCHLLFGVSPPRLLLFHLRALAQKHECCFTRGGLTNFASYEVRSTHFAELQLDSEAAAPALVWQRRHHGEHGRLRNALALLASTRE